ncbi:hypothetical protein RAS12_26065 [Achromobacter seleniivolatilans]|uniref:Uncharacterized protein n=1 Tax=Achromobacter seleniivolatilans TaxID=3047478 RepID=A0ABY9M010_9BURK|nr:hypothetical protein [Achromobacter sp. R39]WMD20040.1 hypothetical protein RAS12_26065 [Achromobacter sp. R39]
MILTQNRLYPLLLATALASTGISAPALSAEPVYDQKPATHASPAPLATPPDGMPQYGVGLYGRSLTLTLHNNRDGAPAPNTPYRLFLSGKGESIQDTPSQDGILHGVTDDQGRTAWVWTDKPHADEDFTLLRRIGDGGWGSFFQLNSSQDRSPLPAWPYIMTMNTRWGEQWVDLGYTTNQGGTAYFSHDIPATSISLSVDAPVTDNRKCFNELDAINRKFSQSDAEGATALIGAMQCADTPPQQLDLAHLLFMNGRAEEARTWLLKSRQWRFPESLKRPESSLVESRLNLERLLGMPDLALADSLLLQNRQAKQGHRRDTDDTDWANNTAYFLADFPDYLDDAETQVRASISKVGPRPYNQGTLGWILFLQGKAEEGLGMMHEAYRDLPRDQEMVADYGLALWQLGQQETATRLWNQAQKQCVWGRRMYDAMRETGYPHPYFQSVESDAVKAYRARCDQPWTKTKTQRTVWG